MPKLRHILEELTPLIFLFLLFAPIYLLKLYELPFQINTDEVAIMLTQKELTSVWTNPFGLSAYFNFPSFVFMLYGNLARALGGIDLSHARMAHALAGLAIILLSYSLFKKFFSKYYALLGAIILGASHSLIGISRLAMRDNSALLFELLALNFLYRGMVGNSKFFSALGGIFAALCYYVYYPARIVIFLWIIFIVLYTLPKISSHFFRHSHVKNFAVTLLFFLLMLLPLIASYLSVRPSSDSHTRSELLIFPQGRQLQREWSGSLTELDGVKANIANGLTTFNNKISDRSYIYQNNNAGFVDPLTGILLWLGFLVLLLRSLAQKHFQTSDLLALVSFLTIWLTLSFVVNKSPNYTRLLIILPFSVYLTLYAAKEIPRLIFKANVALSISTMLVLVVVVWNFLIYRSYLQGDFAGGFVLGATSRYIETKKDHAPYTFYIIADDSHHYFDWGNEEQWHSWANFFTSKQQEVEIISPKSLRKQEFNSPSTIFFPQDLTNEMESSLLKRQLDPRPASLPLDQIAAFDLE